jgi:hypothetical protein
MEHVERKIMTNINEAVALEEGKRVTMDESSIRQRTNLEKPSAVNGDERKLSVASKAYDINHMGQLDEAQRRMRELDKSGRGFVKNEELYEEFRRNLQIQKELLNVKKLVYALIALVIIISLATLGTSFASAILAKDTATQNGVLVVKGDGEAVATQTNAETFKVTVETVDERRRRAQVIDGNQWTQLTVALYANDFIAKLDAQSIESRCDAGRTVYLLRECDDGRKNHVLICGGMAGTYSSGASETIPDTYQYRYSDGKVIILCPNNQDTCTVSVDATYVPACSANIPTMTDESIRIAAEMFKHAPIDFGTLYGPINLWDTSAVTDMSRLFASNTAAFCISDWDVSSVTNMEFMFDFATNFECNLGKWDVSKVQVMRGMFRDADAFTGQGLSNWTTTSLTSTRDMFDSADKISANISSWDVSGVTDASGMFYDASVFSQNLCSWGPQFPSGANVMNMFKNAETCASQGDPVLTATPPGPLCSICV